METNLPKRKPTRLKKFDYSQSGAYFVTICTKDRKNLFWKTVGASIARPSDIRLTRYGEIVNDAIKEIPKHYSAVTIDKYVIMPNHIHLLLQIHNDCDGRPMVAPTVSNIIR